MPRNRPPPSPANLFVALHLHQGWCSSSRSPEDVVPTCHCPACWSRNGLDASPQPIVQKRKVAVSRRRKTQQPAAAAHSQPLALPFRMVAKRGTSTAAGCWGRDFSSFACRAMQPGQACLPDSRHWHASHTGALCSWHFEESYRSMASLESRGAADWRGSSGALAARGLWRGQPRRALQSRPALLAKAGGGRAQAAALQMLHLGKQALSVVHGLPRL